MKTYSRTETIARMNALAGANVPFLFIVDYAQEQSHIEPLDRIDPATCLFQFPKAGNTETAATALARSTAARCAGPIQWDITPPSPAAYRHSFDLVKQNLLAGNSYLTNLTCRVPVTTNLTLEEIFLHSEALYKLWLKDRFVCFSPEIFVRIEKGKIKSFPMKGTIDATLPDAEQLLMQDTKEAAEHATIVDLIRNDLSMVSEHVEVTSYRYIDRLQTNKGPILQTSYTGIMGHYADGQLDSAVMIRFIEQENGQLHFKAGGGITAKSRWESEYNEVIQKIYVPIY